MPVYLIRALAVYIDDAICLRSIAIGIVLNDLAVNERIPVVGRVEVVLILEVRI